MIASHRSEGYVLTYALLHWEQFGRECVSLMSPDWFADSWHASVFAALAEGAESLGTDAKAVLAFVNTKLGRDAKKLSQMLLNHVTYGERNRSHFDWHLQQLRNSHAERRMASLAADIAENLESGELPLQAVRRECEAIERDLAAEESGGNLSELLDLIEKNREPRWIGTGFARLDDRIHGMRAGDFTVLAGTPGTGKTAFALEVVRHNVRKERPVLVASYEMQKSDLWFRLLSNDLKIPLNRFHDSSQMSGDDRSDVVLGVNHANQWPLHVIQPRRRTVTALEALAGKIDSKQPLSLIVVDYLQLLAGSNPKASRYEQVSEISRELKQLASRLEVPILCCCQLNREAAKDKPRMHHLRDSGQIEQDADTILMLSRPDPKEDLVTIRIEKVRRGRAGAELDVLFHGATQSWSEVNHTTAFDDFNDGIPERNDES